MSFHELLLGGHVAAGAAGLVLGPIAMAAPKRRGRHTRVGLAYQAAFLGLFLSALALAIANWSEVWFLAPVGVFSYAFAFSGLLAARLKPRNWLPLHISSMGGSYIAMLSATLVVNWENLTGTPGFESPLPWLLPTVVGSPLIAWAIARRRLLPRSPVGAE